MSGTFVAVDWGTSALRAYTCAADGRILATFRSMGGILNRTETFEARLASALTALEAPPGAAVVMAGMIGSRQGWIEAPYAETPCSVEEITRRLTAVPNALARSIWIVPGLCDSAGPAPDVMRGEETQLLGLIHRRLTNANVCLTGTHCKWARVEDGAIRRFKTYMTGELFQVLCQHSILGRLMPAVEDNEEAAWEAFDRGLASAERGGCLLNDLFAVRTLGLFDRLPAPSLKSYLSGLLIGHEIAAAAPESAGETVTIVGENRLAQNYGRALARRGLAVELVDEAVVVDGLRLVAGVAGIV
jgi:2-dehydro-3-deoxygalactonokinase